MRSGFPIFTASFLLALFFVTGCGHEKKGSAPFAATNLNFNEAKLRVFGPSCVRCHNEGAKVPLVAYADVKSRIAAIKTKALMDRTMPPGGALSADAIAFLSAWIDAGAPEGTNAEAPKPVAKLEPTYESIRANIFATRCLSCHNPTGKASDVALDPKEDLLEPDEKLVVPGKPEESRLFVAVSRNDKKRMPPAKSLARPLDKDELDVLRAWIQSGAKD
jgi:mono/diheme cytochrome c family protein